LFVPVAIVAAIGGAFTGYSWARVVGEHGLRRVAERMRQGRRVDRIRARFGQAGPLRIALFRVTPGFRVYTSLLAGAVGVDRVRFLLGVGPLIVLWVVVFTAVGALVGAPATRFLSQVQSLVLQGGLLIGCGLGAYLVAYRVPPGGRAVLARLPTKLRVTLAVIVDVALITTVVVGVLTIVNGLLAMLNPLLPVAAVAWWVEFLVIVMVILVCYSVATRRGLKATAGELLLGATYLTRGGQDQSGALRRRLLQTDLRHEATVPAELNKMSLAFRSLADTRRLQVARLLLRQDSSPTDVASALALSDNQAREALRQLEEAGLVVGEGERADQHYRIASDHVRLGLAELLSHATPD
jgi:DNA-binding transcriptional ArsR family regulator